MLRYKSWLQVYQVAKGKEKFLKEMSSYKLQTIDFC